MKVEICEYLSFVGLGIPYFILSIVGICFFIKSCIKEFKIKNTKHKLEVILGLTIVIWIGIYFIYNSIQFAQSLRYLIFLFPFFALFGGYAISILYVNRKRYTGILILLLLIWPITFSSIYWQENTRISASKWMYQTIPNNSIILTEYWDDPLPLPVSSEKNYTIEQLTVFDPDSNEKWIKINTQLKKADYYVLSSNRGWASIPTVPKKYPKMSKFYNDLFSGKTNYSLVKRFIPTYQLFLPFHPNSWLNNWFEEVFTVYDHPSVFIFKNKK